MHEGKGMERSRRHRGKARGQGQAFKGAERRQERGIVLGRSLACRTLARSREVERRKTEGPKCEWRSGHAQRQNVKKRNGLVC
jgi:hypothetical protein